MAANQIECSRLEQRFVMEFSVTGKCKPWELYRRLCDMYGKANLKNAFNLAKDRFDTTSLCQNFKKPKNNIKKKTTKNKQTKNKSIE